MFLHVCCSFAMSKESLRAELKFPGTWYRYAAFHYFTYIYIHIIIIYFSGGLKC